MHNRITLHILSILLSILCLPASSDDTTRTVCECEPAVSVRTRLSNRSFPSVFSAWTGIGWSSVLNKPDLSDMEQIALHDLVISFTMFGDELMLKDEKWSIQARMDDAMTMRQQYASLNPDMIFLLSINMREAPAHTYPPDSPYWVRDDQGQVVRGWEDHFLLNFTHPDVQNRIVEQALAVERCGLYDGIFFDWWHEHFAILSDGRPPGGWTEGWIGFGAEQKARDAILKQIRAKARDDFLIVVNPNTRILPRTGPMLNGNFMETGIPLFDQGETVIDEIEHTLLWSQTNFRPPRIVALEGYGFGDVLATSPTNLQWMRAMTTLSVTHSDGYILYTHGHTHSHHWYDFWDSDLGRPVDEKGQLYQETDGLFIREFTNGWAVYNRSGAAQVITLPEEAQGVANGLVSTEHTLPNLDGEMYLRIKPANPADVNGDGVVNILDLTLVARALGTDQRLGDVNRDGVVNVLDLVMVAKQF